jgi:GWxTD domain-containing protein
MKRLTCLLILMMVSVYLEAQTPNRTAKQKNTKQTTSQPTSEIRLLSINSKFLLKDSTQATVFLKIEFVSESNKYIGLDVVSEKFMLNYALYPDFGSKDRLAFGNINFKPSNTQALGNSQFMVQFDLKRPASNPASGLILAEVIEIGTAKKLLNTLPIRFRSAKVSDYYALHNSKGNVLQMKHYVNVGDTFQVKGMNEERKELYAYRYRHDFEPANSPMNTSPRTAARTLKTDSLFRINSNEAMKFLKEGLYFIVRDTTDTYGLGIVVADKRFPKMTRPEQLIRPVMYMSQSQEIAELSNTKTQKKSLDRYWLTIANGNAEIAKNTIRNYYERVEEANRLFTTYKEGWKTDKGMVYIIMGTPDEVKHSKDRESWVYSQRANYTDINFTFNRRPNQFAEDHYELQRYVEYQAIWYSLVEAWRTGNIKN